ncbi:MAG: elongation factor Ts [Candidatus Staskawiczbacteria bacterium RIFOXYB2_FULL_32_9]|uniref:Elongation factor Ts n=1 Tax=Candidatus Staskawiczbacteria bacterium RIFOXYD1_FULL_32_13 TaxID=1802234 RepID=A0A1G2JP04_9BACT|nr:MAG: Elongation factor Ts [Parcubacteria group bacterium GW2011_GWC2_32_10]OGZ79053.1 MAG: elongation factor Ts [Candidatus Staskawiczbacteria bacterium RIFOXYA2_FULL_32_7]OGZ81010.1 MAG: elongation factor Ts [Candidatus Staskawiczbacteria bacterium RIFOXYB1_FULL_32_11]OGZ81285.1 MAG: elongation factor Ts [Candidatus Staskawiczbacteria bacterium RIFOXYB2_FULL_32_9]OGZ85180.1 MAG: elongation factor Ts [Candidatus Staskawiczbacteria bacterium RIFOXYC2_FULL_32_10]OGZ88864.1 MAG: elongation fac
MVTIEQIKQLRDETELSISEVKKALEEANGDTGKAKEILKALGKKLVGKKADRETSQGIVDTYLHSNLKTGVLLDIRCESDFVAKAPDFKVLAHEICLQIAAMKPLFISEKDIPAEFLDGEIKIYTEQVAGSGKPENIVLQIIEGKLKKYKDSVCLLSQVWVKDETKTVKNLIEEAVGKVGENIEIKKFARFEI